MSEYYVKNIHSDLSNFDMYLKEHFFWVSYDDDADVNACIKDMKYVSKRLKKLDKIEKILNQQANKQK
tara:strand:- start:374 stop:577 length:204 start_codon:yes stop_codon:yes gene_type:complete